MDLSDTLKCDSLIVRAGGTRPACALAVVGRVPRAGASKTRLVPPLTHAEAARLSACFLRDTAVNIIEATTSVEVVEAGGAAAVAVYTPADGTAEVAALLPAGVHLLAQRGADLSARLQAAVTDLLGAGYEALCLINADGPTLPRALLIAAVKELMRAGDRIVLGPARDGGYYLIGLKRAHTHLFEGVEWSTGRVLAQTHARAHTLKLDTSLLPEWYDVDDAATLARLCAELFGAEARADSCAGPAPYAAPHTRAYLAALLAREGRARIWPESPPARSID